MAVSKTYSNDSCQRWMTVTDRITTCPLNTILFPPGVSPLQILETRCMVMARSSMRADTRYGISLIFPAQKVGQPACYHEIGIRIGDCSRRLRSADAVQRLSLAGSLVHSGRNTRSGWCRQEPKA